MLSVAVNVMNVRQVSFAKVDPLGIDVDGGFAEYVAVHQDALLHVPEFVKRGTCCNNGNRIRSYKSH